MLVNFRGKERTSCILWSGTTRSIKQTIIQHTATNKQTGENEAQTSRPRRPWFVCFRMDSGRRAKPVNCVSSSVNEAHWGTTFVWWQRSMTVKQQREGGRRFSYESHILRNQSFVYAFTYKQRFNPGRLFIVYSKHTSDSTKCELFYSFTPIR